MNTIAVVAYSFSVVLLAAKMMVIISIQGVQRMRSRQFRHSEDAQHWGGHTPDREAELVVRGQRALDNASETEPLFMALGALYVALGAWPSGALLYFSAFALARVAHAYFMLRPRQPTRTRVFSISLLSLLAVAVHVCVEAIGRL